MNRARQPAPNPSAPASSPRPVRLDSRRAIALIGRREIRSRLASRALLVGLVTTVALIFAGFAAGSYFGQDDPLRIGLVGGQPSGAVEGLERVAALSETEFEVREFGSRTAAETALEDGEVDGVIAEGTEVLVLGTAPDLVALVTPVWQQATLIDALGEAGLDDQSIGVAMAEAAPLSVVDLDPDPDRGSGDRESLAIASAILLFLGIQLASAYILMGVFEEKTTKVVELVLSSVRARDLLLGKIIGIGILGVAQVAVLVGSAVAAAHLFGSESGPSLSLGMLVSGAVWFVLGYLFYGSVFAAGASLAPRQEDAQSTLAPVSILLMVSYLGAVFAASDPASTLARTISWIPFTAPFAMPGRFAAGDAPWWEVGASMAVTAVTASVVLVLAERIYTRSLIHTDRKLGWREAWSLSA